jgi:hypothetical protein
MSSATAAGHGLLRVYYALEARRDLPAALFVEELARALGYFESKQLRLYDGPRGERALTDVLRETPGLAMHERGQYGRDLQITDRQAKVASHPLFAAAIRAIAPPDDLLPPLAALATVATVTPDFSLLHAITTGHALVELDGLLPDYDRASLHRGWVDFVMAAFLTQGLRAGPPLGEPNVPGWAIDGELIGCLAAGGQDHGIKATFSLDRLAERTGDVIFRAAARAFVANR